MKKVRFLLLGIVILLSIFFSYYLNKLDLLPSKYLLLVLLLVVIFDIIATLFIFSKRKVFNIIGIIIFIILCLFLSFGIYYFNSTNNFIDKTFKVIDEDILEYYVIVKEDTSYNTIKDINNKKVGLVYSNKDIDIKCLDKIRKDIFINEKEYDNYTLLVNDLLNDEIDSIIINYSIYNILVENMSNFNNIKIIDKITVTGKISVEENSKIKEEIKNNKPFNILISGIDTRGDISNVSRSDVNIIITVNPSTYEVLLTSIPRDTYVKLHDTTGLNDKLTHAGIYGIDMLKDTIEDFLSIDINYYVRINFDSLIALVDEIDGIDIDNDIAFKGYTRYFDAGLIHLNGKEALEYSRERKKMPEGDFTRGRHQEKIIEAIINKITSDKKLLLNYSTIMESLSNLFETNIPDELFKNYVKRQIDNMKSWSVYSIDIKGYGSSSETYSMPGWILYVMIPNDDSINSASRIINGMISGKRYKQI